nr:mitochondrial outer membrane protein porin 4 [Tanacetum cinerariifolium]
MSQNGGDVGVRWLLWEVGVEEEKNKQFAMGSSPAPFFRYRQKSTCSGPQGCLIGGEVEFDTASASFTKYTAAISFNKPGLSAALLLMDKGQY